MLKNLNHRILQLFEINKSFNFSKFKMKQYLNRKDCIIGLAKDGKSYQEIEATINLLFDQEVLTTVAVRFNENANFFH